MIYVNYIPLVREWADKHIYYWQGANPCTEERFKDLYSRNYDGLAFFSKSLLEYHISLGHKGIYLPFCADTSFYYPRQPESRLAFDVTYVGNDIKGTCTSMRYIYPASDFDFALFGCWNFSKKNNFHFESKAYLKKFAQISRGRIPENDVPIMYSSAKIILNTNVPQSRNFGVVSLRTYQVLACKGFLISDPLPGMEKELSGKVVFTEGYDDLREKIRYYLAHDEERAAIAEKGYNYVVNEAQSAEAVSNRLLTYLKEICNERN